MGDSSRNFDIFGPDPIKIAKKKGEFWKSRNFDFLLKWL